MALVTDLRLGEGVLGLALGAGDALVLAGDGSLAGGPGGVGAHPRRKTRQSAATAQRIVRPYVVGKQAFTRASERPSGSQDAVGAKLDSPSTAAIVTACASQESFSYVSVSAEQNRSSPTRSLDCQPAAGVFCWREGLRSQA